MASYDDEGEPPSRQSVTLSLPPELLKKLKATGPDWKERINEILRDTLVKSGDGAGT